MKTKGEFIFMRALLKISTVLFILSLLLLFTVLYIEIIYPSRTSGPFPSLTRVAGTPITHISIQLPQILEDRELTLKPSDATWNLQRDNNQIALSGSQLEEGQTLSLHIDVEGFVPAGTYPVTFQTIDAEGHTSTSSTSWIVEVDYILQIYMFFLNLRPILEPLLYVLTPLLGVATVIIIMMPGKAPPAGLPGPPPGPRCKKVNGLCVRFFIVDKRGAKEQGGDGKGLLEGVNYGGSNFGQVSNKAIGQIKRLLERVNSIYKQCIPHCCWIHFFLCEENGRPCIYAFDPQGITATIGTYTIELSQFFDAEREITTRDGKKSCVAQSPTRRVTKERYVLPIFGNAVDKILGKRCINIFILKDYKEVERPHVQGKATFKGRNVFLDESQTKYDVIAAYTYGVSLAHELGHNLGLGKPHSTIPGNLMHLNDCGSGNLTKEQCQKVCANLGIEALKPAILPDRQSKRRYEAEEKAIQRRKTREKIDMKRNDAKVARQFAEMDMENAKKLREKLTSRDDYKEAQEGVSEANDANEEAKKRYKNIRTLKRRYKSRRSRENRRNKMLKDAPKQRAKAEGYRARAQKAKHKTTKERYEKKAREAEVKAEEYEEEARILQDLDGELREAEKSQGIAKQKLEDAKKKLEEVISKVETKAKSLEAEAESEIRKAEKLEQEAKNLEKNLEKTSN